MRIGDLIIAAVRNNDAQSAGNLSDLMCFKYGLNYSQIYERVKALTGIGKAEWDELLYESERSSD